MSSLNANTALPQHPPTPPVALTIAGSDSGGGAGIQADLKTFAAFGVYGCSAITALTAQNTRGVQAVHPVPPDFVLAQIDSVLSDFPVAAIKTGMLANAAIIGALAEKMAALQGREAGAPALVVDPVMLATSGDRLLEREAEARLIEELLPKATLITPNLPEAAALLGTAIAQTPGQCWQQAEQLLEYGPQGVLLKGGHGDGPDATDRLLLADGTRESFSLPRLQTRNNHGSGCTLGAAVAAALARGASLPGAVAEAKAYLHQAMSSGAHWQLGRGNGPVNHFYHLSAFDAQSHSEILSSEPFSSEHMSGDTP